MSGDPAGAPGPPGAQVPPPAPPRRVAVTAPRRNRSGGWSTRAAAEDLRTQPRLGQIYVRALVRDQLRLALGVLAALAAVLGGLPAAFALLPGLRTAEVVGIRLPWLLLGAVAYPVMVGAAWFHVRHAERVERDFSDLLHGPPAGECGDPGALKELRGPRDPGASGEPGESAGGPREGDAPLDGSGPPGSPRGRG